MDDVCGGWKMKDQAVLDAAKLYVNHNEFAWCHCRGCSDMRERLNAVPLRSSQSIIDFIEHTQNRTTSDDLTIFVSK